MEDWNAKVGSQETPGVRGKFGLGVKNEANRATVLTREQLLTKLTVLKREQLVIANTHFQQHREDSIHAHHQMVNIEIRLIIFCASKHGEALYTQQKQGQDLTGSQIMKSLLSSSDLK